MPTRLNLRKSTLTDRASLAQQVRLAQYDVTAQLRKPTGRGTTSLKVPIGEGAGDMLTRVGQDGAFHLNVSDQRGKQMSMRLPADLSTSVAFKTGTVAPVLADYPNDGDNGYFYDTVASKLYYVRNYQGTLIYINFVSISGTITAAQHGDLSGAGATNMHAFTQLTGAITAAQHGSQTVGTLHAVATTAVAGFLSTAFFDLLDGATSAATANALVRRGAAGAANFAGTLGVVDVDASGHYEVDGTQVVTNQQTGWSAWSGTVSRASHATYTAGTAGAAYDQTLAQNAFDALQHVSRSHAALLQNLATHGLIDS